MLYVLNAVRSTLGVYVFARGDIPSFINNIDVVRIKYCAIHMSMKSNPIVKNRYLFGTLQDNRIIKYKHHARVFDVYINTVSQNDSTNTIHF